MKPFLIITFILMCHLRKVNSLDVFELFVSKVKEFGTYVQNSFTKLFNTMKNYLTLKQYCDKTHDVHGSKYYYENITKYTKHKPNRWKNERKLVSSLLVKSETKIVMPIAQLVSQHGMEIESHVVSTRDGYLITLHRIKSEKINSTLLLNTTVLLHHGILGSATDWIILGPEKSLPYMLLKAGYDVWLINARGNFYSRDRLKRVPESQYWNFSWEEMGRYDLPAVINYITQEKDTNEGMIYIGHSMGATVFLTMLSLMPCYNLHFKMALLLAPLVFMDHSEGPLHALSSVSENMPKDLSKLIGEGEFMPSNKVPLVIVKKYCRGLSAYCVNPLLFLTGSTKANNSWDHHLAANILQYVPSGGSTNTVLHYAQMIKNKKFHAFKNKKVEFRLNNITVPIALFSSNDDAIATVPDVLNLFFNLTCPIENYVITDKNISHMGFMWNAEVTHIIYTKVMEYSGENMTCNTNNDNEI